MGADLEAQIRGLREELEKLKYEFRVDLPKRISEARSYGDLKENAEYHAARERQSFVKARIAQVTEQLNQLRNIDTAGVAEDAVAYGSAVTVYDYDSEERYTYTLVSANEVNPSEGKISLSSPIGSSLNNRKAGDTVEVQIPAGKRRYYVEKIVTLHGNVLEKRLEG
ncbi:MAG: transcription elongation factor GreA [Spirochaetes bacterium]|nr:transcription elongation factor GreA [Spirochaetota bacterium]